MAVLQCIFMHLCNTRQPYCIKQGLFRAFRCILYNFKKFFKKVAFLFKIKVFISCCMVLYTQARKQVLAGGVKAHTYSREVSQLPISKAFLLYFPMGIFSDRFPTPIPHCNSIIQHPVPTWYSSYLDRLNIPY